MPKTPKSYVYRCKRDNGQPHWMASPRKLDECIAYVHGNRCGADLVQKAGPRK